MSLRFAAIIRDATTNSPKCLEASGHETSRVVGSNLPYCLGEGAMSFFSFSSAGSALLGNIGRRRHGQLHSKVLTTGTS